MGRTPPSNPLPRHRGGVRSGRLPVIGLALSLVGAACGGDLETRTRDLASEARSQAEGRLDEVMEERLADVRERFGGSVDVDQVCALVADDRLTAPERARLELAVELGEVLGLPADLTSTARTLLGTTDGATERVGDLRDVCADLGSTRDVNPDG